DVACRLEQRDPAIPARGQQPEPVNEDNGSGARRVRALDLRCFVPGDGWLGGLDGHLFLLHGAITRHGSHCPGPTSASASAVCHRCESWVVTALVGEGGTDCGAAEAKGEPTAA